MQVSSNKFSGAVLVAVALCAIAFSSTAMADEGRITFSGAISAPTCAASTWLANVSSVSESTSPSERTACADSGKQASSPGRFYASTAVRLSENESDKVLQYFDRYIKASGPDAKDPVLLTQTYE